MYLANWSINYSSSIFANPEVQLIRLLEIVSTSMSSLNLYSRVDYYRPQSRLEVSTLSGSISNKKSININLSLDNSTSSLVIVWTKPQLSLFVNCQLLIKIDFIKSTEIQVLSLPYYQPESLKSFGGTIQSQSDSFIQKGCLASSTIPTYTDAITASGIKIVQLNRIGI